jgi:hypothetical protein
MRRPALAALALLTSVAAAAAEPTFPRGSRIGIEPPREATLSSRFSGFENQAKGLTITFAEMPAEAFQQLAAGLSDEALKRQGFSVKSRETVKLGERTGFLIFGDQASGKVLFRKWVLGLSDPTMTALVIAQGGSNYTPEEIEAALKSVALRAPLSIQDQLSALSFKLGDLAGFRPVRVLSGTTLMMTEGPSDVSKVIDQPVLVIARSPTAGPPPGEGREQFARAAIASQQTFRNLEIERSQPFRQNGQDWHEIVARATDGPTGQPIVVMQTIRFGGGDFVRMVGIVRADKRDVYLPRFRKVIDTLTVE